MKALAILPLTAIFSLAQIVSSAQKISSVEPCRLSCPSNMVVKTENGQEGATVFFPATNPVGDCGPVSYSPASGTFFRLGPHSVIASTASGQKCSFTVTVTDNEPPSLSPISLSRNQLWPASNKLKKVAVYYSASDNAGDVSTVLSVYSNDTESNLRDYEVINNHLLRLKASRLPSGAPRIYTITVVASDEAGNKTTRTTSIAVSATMTPKKK